MPLIRASRDFIFWLDLYRKKDKLTREQALDQVLKRWEQPAENPAVDIDHLNLDKKDGEIQTYLRKREARLAERKARIEEAYLREQAKQKAKTEGEANRAEIVTKVENEKRFARQYIRSGKVKVDMGNSEGDGEPDWHEGYR
jgi:hypothetical protein